MLFKTIFFQKHLDNRLASSLKTIHSPQLEPDFTPFTFYKRFGVQSYNIALTGVWETCTNFDNTRIEMI